MRRGRQEMSEKASLAERRANALQAEVEEARSLLDSVERGKMQTEAELSEARAAINEMTSINSRAASNKRAVESERRVKELSFQMEEDKKNQKQMSELATKLQVKIKNCKKQIEEAEEIAALNFAKFRKAQQELEETEERANMAEAQLSTVRPLY